MALAKRIYNIFRYGLGEGARTVLCLGARLGTEVSALHSLGYFAIGIDLNPGEENPYVLLRLCCSCQLAGKPAAGSACASI